MEYRTLKQIFTNSVKKFSKLPALSMFERESMTYGELGERVAYVSDLLRGAGLGAGDKVVLLSSSMPNWGVCYFAAVNAGMVIVPIMPEFSSAELDMLIAHSEAKALCVSDKLYTKLSEETISRMNIVIFFSYSARLARIGASSSFITFIKNFFTFTSPRPPRS